MPDLLIEIGCEDLPAVAVREAKRQVPGCSPTGSTTGLDANTVGVHVSPPDRGDAQPVCPASGRQSAPRCAGPRPMHPRRPPRFSQEHGLEVGDLVERDGLMWAISDGVATPGGFEFSRAGGTAHRRTQLFQVDAVGSRPLLSSRPLARGQLRQSGGSGGAVRPGRNRRVARPSVPGRPGGGGKPHQLSQRYALCPRDGGGGGAPRADQGPRDGATPAGGSTRSQAG